jgi:hypothetical protein
MPVVLLRTATKQLQEGFQAAKSRLSLASVGRSFSFSDRSDKSPVGEIHEKRKKPLFEGHASLGQISFGGHDSSVDMMNDNNSVTRPSLPFALDETSSKEKDDSEVFSLGHNDEVDDSISVHESDIAASRTEQPPSDSGSRCRSNSFVNFFKRRSHGSGSASLDDCHASRFSSFLRNRQTSDMSRDSDSAHGEPTASIVKTLWGRRRSDMSSMSLDSDEEHRITPHVGHSDHHHTTSREKGLGMIHKLASLKRSFETTSTKFESPSKT